MRENGLCKLQEIIGVSVWVSGARRGRPPHGGTDPCRDLCISQRRPPTRLDQYRPFIRFVPNFDAIHYLFSTPEEAQREICVWLYGELVFVPTILASACPLPAYDPGLTLDFQTLLVCLFTRLINQISLMQIAYCFICHWFDCVAISWWYLELDWTWWRAVLIWLIN